MTDHEQGAVERYMANRRESHVDLGTVPCGICGERVRIGMNGVWSAFPAAEAITLALTVFLLKRPQSVRG